MEIGKIDLSKIKLKRPKLGWGWRYIDASIVVMGIAIAILVWFIPSLDQNKDLQAFMKSQKEAKAYAEKVKAVEAARKKEEEDLGIIWVPPPATLQPTQGSAKAAPKNAPAQKAGAKPAPVKKPQ
jgi:hypothetical protein